MESFFLFLFIFIYGMLHDLAWHDFSPTLVCVYIKCVGIYYTLFAWLYIYIHNSNGVYIVYGMYIILYH